MVHLKYLAGTMYPKVSNNINPQQRGSCHTLYRYMAIHNYWTPLHITV